MPKADPRATKGRARGERGRQHRARATPGGARPAEAEKLRHLLSPARSRLLALTLVAAAGLLVTSYGLALSRSNPDSSWAEPLFWIGLVLIVMPFAGHLARAGAGRGEMLVSPLGVGG